MILEIAPAGARGLFLNVDEDRTIHFEKLKERPVGEFVKAIERKRFVPVSALAKGARRTVIAAIDPALATTIPVPLTLVRDEGNGATKITLPELENLIAQAMAKIFNGCRGEAAKRLAQNELDAVLVKATADEFAVDGKSLRNPVAFAGKRITLLLELVFVTRELFEDLKPLFNKAGKAGGEGAASTGGGTRFFFAEAPQAHLRALSRSRALPLNIVSADHNQASLYVFARPNEGGPAVLYREKLKWRFGALTDALKQAFAVGDAAAEEMYCLYHTAAMSDAARRTLKKAIDPALDALLAELERAKVTGPVYVEAPHPMPFSAPYRHGTLTFEAHPARTILGDLGFTIPQEADDFAAATAGENGEIFLRSLLYFTEAYFDKSDSAINRKLRRRLHWLVPT